MTRTEIAAFTRALARLSDLTGISIPHAVMCGLASLQGSDWQLVDETVFDAHTEAAVERRREDPAFWAV